MSSYDPTIVSGTMKWLPNIMWSTLLEVITLDLNCCVLIY